MKQEPMVFFKKLIDSISPSGFEQEAVEVWKNRTEAFVKNISIDVQGNCIGVLAKPDALKVMLAGHIDEIGYMVNYIDKDGYIYFAAVGGIDLHLVPGQRVWIKTKTKRVLGVIGKKPIHVLEDAERKKVATIDQLWIDIGTTSDEQTRQIVEIGDIAVPAVGFEVLNEDKVVGRGFDDKAGAFVVSEVLRQLSGLKLPVAVYGVATVQEEIGLRGAQTSAYGINPDIGIAIDVAFATDFPGMEKKKIGEIDIGKGPVIARGPNINHKIFDLLIQTAKQEKIPYQVSAAPRATGTDANVIQLTRQGVATALISIPLRYMHTPVELISLLDLENTIKLIKAFILKLDKPKL
ncbi:MAG: M42 family metallopeptidase [Candidatus Omnitrophica bacterium]|nr:M42 family metallopeptidase [Candidatus Omnitrophota bacterium]